jgi:hypothetical protein
MPAPDDTSLPEWLVVGFCGHRHLVNVTAIDHAIGTVLTRLEQRHPLLVGISSAAFGADLLFAEQMQRRGHPLQLVLPFPPERFRQDFTEQPDDWSRAERTIARAIAVDLAAPAATSGDAYLEAGVRTIERADIVIAVWDGEPARGVGGTGDVVAYARSIGRPLVIIDAKSGNVAEAGATRDADLKVRPTYTPIGPDPREQVRSFFAKADADAARYAPVVRELTRWLVWLHLIAASVTSAALVFGAEGLLALAATAVDVGVLVSAFFLLMARGRRHEAWRRRRAEAELARSADATWDIRRGAPTGVANVISLPGFTRLSQTLDIMRQLDRSPPQELSSARAVYLRHRVADQQAYFATRQVVAHRQVRRRKIVLGVCTAVGVAASLALAVTLFVPRPSPLVVEWLEFAGIAGPLGASAMGVLLISDESSRRNERYAEVASALQTLLPRVEAASTWDSLNRVATEVEEQLLRELLEWRSFVRNTESIH